MTEYYSIQSSQDVIEHFGIKGMRWGHRKKKFYEKRSYLKNPSPDKALMTFSDMGKIRKNMGLTRRDFMLNPKYRDKANAEISRITNLKKDIGKLDYALKHPNQVGVYGIYLKDHGKHLKGKELKEWQKRTKFDNSKKNRHPEYLDIDDFNKWVKNAERLTELGTKGAKIKRKQLISEYEKFSG
nr:MAG TPA: hypothetical protein [Caudoviricetes sp.]